MSEAAPTPKRRSAIDTLVVRDHTAVFWFVVAIATAAGCSWYVNLMSEALKLQSSFVVMDTAGAYYVPPGLPYSQMDTMHIQLSEMVVETVLDRTREGLTFDYRTPKLFQKPALIALRKYLEKEAGYFRDQNTTQTFQIDKKPVITYRGVTTVTTVTKGLVHRISYLGNQMQEKTYEFSITLAWRLNRDMVRDKNFPSLVEVMQINEFQKTDEPAPAAAEAPKSDAQ